MSKCEQPFSTELINQDSLQVRFIRPWYQEDISDLTTYVLSFISDHYITENTVGADRAYCRFEWQAQHYILNFECYSESCWIENENLPDKNSLYALKQHIDLSYVQ